MFEQVSQMCQNKDFVDIVSGGSSQPTAVSIGGPKKTTDKLQRLLGRCCGTNRPKKSQLRSKGESVAAKRASLAGRRRLGSVQSPCPGVQVSAQHGGSIPVVTMQAVSIVPGRRHLRSADRGELNYPRINLATYGERHLPTPVLQH